MLRCVSIIACSSLLLAACSNPIGNGARTNAKSSGGSDGGIDDVGTTTGVADTTEGDPDATDPTDTVDPIDGDEPIEDVAPDTGPSPTPDTGGPPDLELPPPNANPAFSNCSAPGGDRNIYDLQDPQCPDHITPEPTESPGAPIVLEGVVATGVFGDTTFVQEVGGGAYSGINVFTHGIPPIDVTPGTVLNITGGYYEFFGLSQIWLESWEIVSQGPAPQPFAVSHPAHVATGGAMAEMMEGVLIRVEDLKTIHTKPDCPNDWGEFLVSGDLRVDNMAAGIWDARLGDEFDAITGLLTYTFDNYKLEPRTTDDLKFTKKGGESSVSKCIESDCIVPITTTGTGQIIVNEIMADPFENDTGQEWIELYNPGAEDVSVDGWEIRDCGGQSVELIGANLVIPAKGYLVIGSKTNMATNGGVPVDMAYGTAFYLPNTVGAVILFDGTDDFSTVVDQTRYTRFDEWETVFVTGHSMERKSPTSDGTQASSWAASQTPFGTGQNFGTPAAKND